MKTLMQNFIDNYCTKILEKLPDGYFELMCDNHDIIEWGEDQYFVPQDNILWDEDDELIRLFLIQNY